MQIKETVQWQTRTGDKVTVGDLSISPQSRALVLRWRNGGWVWNRPVAVLVERGEEQVRLPIVDVTRLAQVGLVALTIAFSIVAFALSFQSLAITIQKRRNGNE